MYTFVLPENQKQDSTSWLNLYWYGRQQNSCVSDCQTPSRQHRTVDYHLLGRCATVCLSCPTHLFCHPFPSPTLLFSSSSHLFGPGRESLLESLDEVVTLLLSLESPRGNKSIWSRVRWPTSASLSSDHDVVCANTAHLPVLGFYGCSLAKE